MPVLEVDPEETAPQGLGDLSVQLELLFLLGDDALLPRALATSGPEPTAPSVAVSSAASS